MTSTLLALSPEPCGSHDSWNKAQSHDLELDNFNYKVRRMGPYYGPLGILGVHIGYIVGIKGSQD